MKNYIIINLLSLIPYLISAQGGLINNGVKIRVSANTYLKIIGGIISKSNASITNLGSIYLTQDWVQTGLNTTYTGSGWMWFNGSNNQTISSASFLTIPKLRMNNGNRLILNSPIRITTQLDLNNNGSIQLGNNNLVLNSASTITNYNANNYIITNGTGVLQQVVSASNVVFPTGNSSYNPATLSNSGVIDSFQIRVVDQVLSSGNSGAPELTDVVNRTWMIEEETTGGSSVSMTLQWDTSDELVGFTRNPSGIAHWTGSHWDYGNYSGAVANGSYWTQSRTGVSSFSLFVVTDRSELLPIDLIDFKAKRINRNQVLLNWETTAEINNKGFEIERMLANENSFTKVGWVNGNKTTSKSSTYELIDDNSLEEVAYYRLKQIDIDETFSYSKIRVVQGNSSTQEISLYPNPVYDYLNIQLPKNIHSASIQILDSKGCLVKNITRVVNANHLLHLQDLEPLTSGFYWIRIVSDQKETFSRKFIKK